ncbi:PKD domain-containing protein, partial [Modestobacter sp. SSW1-42]|uniref:PKD domain-containing protein n=1 Tax=Modestobacter sp. SSW1-42 TaxID=596372 RepID=UPI0039857A81
MALADTAPLQSTNATTPVTVSADPLPTTQIDGVAWSQVIVGNTVYVAGEFQSARPDGAPAGTGETPRHNLLAYDVRTGVLDPTFAPDLNGQALVVTASPDGSRIYVGGDFTSANGQPRWRVAAFSTATGQLVPTFSPAAGGQVRAIVATDSAVYLGGNFTSVAGVARDRLAAVSAADGAVLPWAPKPGVGSTAGNRLPNNDPANALTSKDVMAMVLAGNQVVVAGRFDSLNGVKATGVGALDPVSGATRPFAINQLITNQGVNSAIYSLTTDGTNVYGSGYDYYGPGNVEGAWAAEAATGKLVWMADCHGDTYSTYVTGGALYVAGHPHDCSNIGGYPEVTPRVSQYGVAYSVAPAGTVGSQTLANQAFVGKPAPALQNWFPTFLSGTYTKQYQAGWSVAGNGRYVVYGGEFPGVNNQQHAGLVRFAVPAAAPNKVGPAATDGLTPSVASFASGTARISWSTTSDRDNQFLTYSLYRSDRPDTPVYQTTASSLYWQTARLGFLDTGLTPGASYGYRVSATDPFGNTVTRGSTTVTVASTGSLGGTYAQTVRADGATDQWRLGEASGATSYDYASAGLDLQAASGVTRGAAGALAGDTDRASSFDGTSNGYASTRAPLAGPNTFTLEALVKTTSSRGGKIIGFGDKATGTSSNYDRHVYLDNSGYVYFGVNQSALRTLKSPARINDGRWHQVVATLSPSGMVLFVDGKQVASRTDTTSGQPYKGYWRVGGDTTAGWSGAGTSGQLNGQIDEVAVYPTALTAAQVANHHAAATTGKGANLVPTAAFTSSASQLTVSVDGSTSADTDGKVATYAWDFGDGATGTGATASHTYTAGGTFTVTLTVTDDRGATGTATRQVTVTAPPPNAAPTASFSARADRLVASFDAAASGDTDGKVATYAWDFGDGATGTGATASHTYTAGGTFTVTLTVTDDRGATG